MGKAGSWRTGAITAFALVFAGGGVAGDARAHGDRHDAKGAKPSAPKVAETDFGRTGDPRRVTRTVRIDMSDRMRFTPDRITVKVGETVRIVGSNSGKVMHELVLGTERELKEHAELMKKFPGMEHSEPSMTHVKPGASGEIVWKFTKAGEFQFACLIPGHFEAGMVGKVNVASR